MAQEAIVFADVTASPPPPRRLSFHGDGLTLLGIYLINLLFTVLTLGVYYFWARTRVRGYLLSQTEFEGDRFAWHGTGKELLVGFLKIIGFILVAGGAVVAVQLLWKHPVSGILVPTAAYLFNLLIVPLAIVGSRRYRLSRVSWRGIRFSFRGRAREFLRVYVAGMLLTFVTLGFYYPFFHNNARRYLVDRSYFGTTRFRYDGEGGPLFVRYFFTLYAEIIALVLIWVAVGAWLGFRSISSGSPREIGSPPEIGALLPALIPALILTALILVVAWASYIAFRHRYYWGHTTVATAQFRSTMTTWKLLRFMVTNLLLLIVTVGLALPWAVVRNMRFLLANVGLEGPLDLAAIQQDAQAAAAAGEALGDILGLDFFDIDLGI